MKTKVLLLSFLLLFNISTIIRQSEIIQFLLDGRPKCITYYRNTFMFVHMEVEVIKPKIFSKDRASVECMNIYFFPETYHLHHTIHLRYINFIEI
jgi:hypothetical protein